MTEPPVELPPSDEPEVAPLPRWIPILIGVVLVVMAALAVYTGLRFRESASLTSIIHPRRSASRSTPAPAPPGEPQPGSSLVFPGEDGANTPSANTPVAGRSRAEITGGGTGGVQSTVRMWARRGMMTSVVHNEAVVYVNELLIGQASQFDKPDEVYDFPAPGSYTIRITAPGYRDATFVVTAAENAKIEVARIQATLVKQ
jgi:hypothetical protein